MRVQGGAYWSVPEILEGEEYDATWAALLVDRPHYADYQTKTERTIPLVRLAETRPAYLAVIMSVDPIGAACRGSTLMITGV